jgi:hypothetical protein
MTALSDLLAEAPHGTGLLTGIFAAEHAAVQKLAHSRTAPAHRVQRILVHKSVRSDTPDRQ